MAQWVQSLDTRYPELRAQSLRAGRSRSALISCPLTFAGTACHIGVLTSIHTQTDKHTHAHSQT